MRQGRACIWAYTVLPATRTLNPIGKDSSPIKAKRQQFLPVKLTSLRTEHNTFTFITNSDYYPNEIQQELQLHYKYSCFEKFH
jgi:hypothetical protein